MNIETHHFNQKAPLIGGISYLTHNKMKFKTIYDACKYLMYEEEIPTKVIIGSMQMTILVYGNGTYQIIK